MAVGLERAHAEFVSQGEGLAVVGYGGLALRGLAPRRNVTKEAQGIRLVATFVVLTGECQRLLGEALRLLQVTGQHLRFPQNEMAIGCLSFCCHHLFHRLCEQWHGVGHASG